MVAGLPGTPVAVFCADDNYADQPRPRRAGLSLQKPDAIKPFLTGAPIEDVLITAADPRALVPSGSEVLCPRGCERLDVGVSLAAIVGGDGPSPSIATYVPVLDFMRLDVSPTQTYLARSFPTHKVVGEPVEASEVDPAAGLGLQLHVDGELRQDSSTASMVASLDELLATIGGRYALRAGDLILSGSPAGRPGDTDGPWISPGSAVEGEVAGLGTVSATVVAEDA